MYRIEYNVPDTMFDLFKQKENCYSVYNYDPEMEMDNIQSMQHFLEFYDDEFNWEIVEDLGTGVRITHNSFSYDIWISSSGLGDFFSHGFETEVYYEDNQ